MKQPKLPFNDNQDHVLVNAKRDIPPFQGADDYTHHLKAGDTATIPKGAAQILAKRGLAIIIEVAQ